MTLRIGFLQTVIFSFPFHSLLFLKNVNILVLIIVNSWASSLEFKHTPVAVGLFPCQCPSQFVAAVCQQRRV